MTLDADISTRDALAHLSSLPDQSPEAWSRRRFLGLVGAGLGAGLVANAGGSLLDTFLGDGVDTAWAAGPLSAGQRVLIVVGMFGGNDGLNTSVGFNDGHYYDQHRGLAIPGNETLRLNASTGLHPALSQLHAQWTAGRLAVIEGVGYPNADLSHFNSMARWMSATPTGIPQSGWIGRWLDTQPRDLYLAAEIGTAVPFHMIGRQAIATAVPAGKPVFGAGTSTSARQKYAAMRTFDRNPAGWAGRVNQASVDSLDLAARTGPLMPATLPTQPLTAKFEVAARLVNANFGFRVLTIGYGDFDSHAGQDSQHDARMAELDHAIARFYQVIGAGWRDRVTFVTFSEFGRTSYANDGGGTDHGTSNVAFAFGAGIRGGIYGTRPSLARLGRWDRMAHHVDFRDMFGTVAEATLGAGSAQLVGQGHAFRNLGFATAGSATPTPPPPAPPIVNPANPAGIGSATGFTVVTPRRLLDTRQGLGGHPGKFGPGETVRLAVAGVAGVPASGVASVVLNVTSVDYDSPSYLTVWEARRPRPNVSALNPVPGQATPNMVVSTVSTDGRVDIFNERGHGHVIVDVLGYFSASGTSRLTAVTPKRLLDTRNGIGAPRARLGDRRVVHLTVRGRGGVAATATAVVVNITAVGAGRGGYVTAWASGRPMPDVSNGNYHPGGAVPTTSTVNIGSNGKISLFVETGPVDLLVDVVGYYSATGATFTATSPQRLLDTRTGVGAPQGPVGTRSTITLPVGGRAGVPTNATAVLINATAVDATAETYVTVHPDPQRPDASSLNVANGDARANMVLCKLGADRAIRLYNDAGAVHLIADVVGYYR